MSRAVVRARGQVQGVGFRFTTRRLAARHEVDGWVKNMPDASVRIEAEGRDAELDRFFNAIKTSRLGSGITGWEETRGPSQGMDPGFDIAY